MALREVEAVTAQDRKVGRMGAPDHNSRISIRGIRKAFGKLVAIKDFSLEVAAGEVVSLLGPSGCGKTTTLRCLAGLEAPDVGEIEINGRPVFSGVRNIMLPPEKRGLSMVFQQYALWPHMSVFENVAFGLRVQRAEKSVIAAQTESALRRVRLWEKRQSRISELSGGQQQRVALARAIAIRPDIILFDEPLSNLDAKLREELRFELLQLQRDLGFSAIYVTHDQDEAISLSSRIVIMNNGVCEQVGTPREIWNEPATSFVAKFIGSTNLLRGRVSKLLADDGGVEIETDAGPVIRSTRGSALSAGQRVEAYVRMSALSIKDTKASGRSNCWASRVRLVSFQGDSTLYEVAFGEERLKVHASGDAIFSEGDAVTIAAEPADVLCYPA
jgi:ABC-type Fe3+/spermidine/putrescine transport system ATPase subunit